MIKSTKHRIIDCNQGKLVFLDQLFVDYKSDLITYINYIIDGILPLKVNLSSKDLPTEIIKHSKYKREIYKQASSILRSQMDKTNKKRYNSYKRIYSYMKTNHPDSLFVKKKYSELNLKSVLKSKYFTIPNLNNLSINLTNEFFNIQSSYHFDSFVNLKLPYFNEKGTRSIQINIPLNNHKYSNNIKSEGFMLRNNIQIKKIDNNYYINLIWFKESITKRTEGSSLGMDMGYHKLLCDHNGNKYNGNLSEIYNEISRKKQGSKSFKKLLTYRDNEINQICNNIPLNNVKDLVIEDLKSVKTGKKYFNNKIQRWSYVKTVTKLERICDEYGINMVKVSPSYTSQTCSACGHIDKENRKGQTFHCLSCDYENDADVNASINIRNRGIYSSSTKENELSGCFSI
jgi:IS605 OrfB family transposase